ncbi:MAG TPA: helix-turn-helix domain-containing protein, partial [Solirubrobacteraceae bacterium]|nr:helix-turn-helix domain-containing protein [Solirubrobacteraceae bacterium]
MSAQPDRETLTQSEAARRLGLSVKTIRRMLDRGALTAVASGRRGGALRVLHDSKLDILLSDSLPEESDTSSTKSDIPSSHAANQSTAPRSQPARAAPHQAAPNDANAQEEPRLPRQSNESPAPSGESDLPTRLSPTPEATAPDDDWVRLTPRLPTQPL